MTTDPSAVPAPALDSLGLTGTGGHIRSVEVEVTATPAQVWEAIATAEGNAGWSFPTEIEGRVGGEVRIHRQPYGGTAVGTVVAWDPEWQRWITARGTTCMPVDAR